MAEMEGERCRRRGTSWRCPEKALPGKPYCEKHHLYVISRNKSPKSRKISGAGANKHRKCNRSSAVEPYRPVIDFKAAAAEVAEVGLSGGTGNDKFALEEESGFGGGFFDSFGGGDHGGDDTFALDVSDFDTAFYNSFGVGDPGVELGGNDNFALDGSGFGAGFFDGIGCDQGAELGGGGGNDHFSLGEAGGGGCNQSGWSGNGDFPEGKNQEFTGVGRNEVKCDGQIGESGCGLSWREYLTPTLSQCCKGSCPWRGKGNCFGDACNILPGTMAGMRTTFWAENSEKQIKLENLDDC